MAVLTAQGIVDVGIALLTRRIALPRTVTMIPGGVFTGRNGDTVTVPVPQPGEAREQETRGANISYDDVTEVPVDVSLKHFYHAKLTSDEEMSFDIENFARQVTRVQVDAVAVKAEAELGAAMNNLSGDLEVAADGSDVDEALIEARETLGRNDAPMEDRWLAASPEFVSLILGLDVASKVNESGTSDALRNAVVARWRGFTVVESNRLDAGTALAYHRSGFCFATRIPVMPRGATSSATTTNQGIALRQIFQYESSKLSDASVISTFAGASAVHDDESGLTFPRIVKLTTAGS